MQFSLLLPLLLLHLPIKSSSISYIQCTSQCPKLTLTFDNPFSTFIDCPIDRPDNFTTALVCEIDYRIDYDTKQIYLNFKATNDSHLLDTHIPSEYLSQSIWLGFNSESNQPNITHRAYACNRNDDCARKFYHRTIRRLINDGLIIVEEIKINLYNSSSEQFRCRNNRTTVTCPYGLCYALNIEKKQSCTSDRTATLFTEIEYRQPRNSSRERQLIEYKCNRPLCNGHRMMEKIQNLLLDYTHGISRKTHPVKSIRNDHQRLASNLLLLVLFAVLTFHYRIIY